MGIRLGVALSMVFLAFGQNEPTGVKVHGRVADFPMDAPPGVIRVSLGSPDLGWRDVAVGADGSFEFESVPPGRFALGVEMIRARTIVVNVEDKNIEGVEIVPVMTQLFGQVTIDSGAPFPAGRDQHSPVFGLEARRVKGGAVRHQFVRSDGVFGFLPIEVGDYQIRATRLPEGYAVKSISYGGKDALNASVKLDAAGPYGFLRVVLTKDDGSSVAPGPSPAKAKIAPNEGEASLVFEQSGQGRIFIEGSHPYFTVRSTSGDGFKEERRLGGEWCSDSRGCGPGPPNGHDSATIFLSPGSYEVSGYVRPCNGNCGRLDPPLDECRAVFTIRKGETIYAERIQSMSGRCVLNLSSKSDRSAH